MNDIKIVLEELKADSESGKLATPAGVLRARPKRLRWLMAAGRILGQFDCFAGTTKERTAKRYRVVGVNLTATRL
jgi:hypothetical protein